MVSEVLGLSGVGKTYYCEKYSKENNKVIIQINSKFENTKFVIKFLLKNFRISLSILRILMKENSKSILYHKIKLLFRAMAKEEKSKKYENSIIDEGLLQFSYSIYDRKTQDKDYERYIRKVKSLNPKRKIIIIEANEEKRSFQMKLRNRIPRSKFGIKYAKQIQEIIKVNHQTIKETIKKNFKEIKTINN